MAMINDIKVININSGETLELSTRSTPHYILEECKVNPIDGVINMQDMIGIDGTSISNVRLGTRTVAITGWIIGMDDAEISFLRERLNRMINPRQRISIVYNGYKLDGTPTSTIVYGTANKVMNEKMCRFFFSVFCDNPLIRKENQSILQISHWEPGFSFPLEFDEENDHMSFGVKSPSRMLEITNPSNIPVGMKITLSALGEVHFPRLINVTTQEYLEISMIMESHDKVTIDNSDRYILANLHRTGESDQNIINMITDDSTLPFLLPIGINLYTYNAEVNPDGLQITLEFSPAFLEVI